MARPRSFDVEDVLKSAEDIFWTKGFRGTSLDDITEATGVNKPSLYAAFGDKTALYLQILERYHARLLYWARKTLSAEGPAVPAIQKWLMAFVPACSGEGGARGCLSINASIDAADAAPAVAEAIARYNQELVDLIGHALERAKQNGEIDRDLDSSEMANLIHTFYNGLFVTGRTRPAKTRTRAMIELILRPLTAESV